MHPLIFKIGDVILIKKRKSKLEEDPWMGQVTKSENKNVTYNWLVKENAKWIVSGWDSCHKTNSLAKIKCLDCKSNMSDELYHVLKHI